MRRSPRWIGFLLGLLTGVPVLVLTYLGDQFAGLPFVPITLLDWMTRLIPRLMVLVGIDRLLVGQEATTPNLGALPDVSQSVTTLGVFVLIGGLFGLVLGALHRRAGRRLLWWGVLGGLVLGALVSLIQAAVSFPAAGPLWSVVWLGILFTAWGLVLGWLIDAVLAPRPAGVPADVPAGRALSRRGFLYLLGAVVAAVVAGVAGLAVWFARRPGTPQVAGGPAKEETPDLPLPTAEVYQERISPAPGTRPELTSNEDFYRIDINVRPPAVDGTSWRLILNGLVDNPMTLTLDQIRDRPAVEQYVTMSCISNNVGGELISSSLWKGIRLRDLLEEAGLQAGAQEVYITAADGFYESVSMADTMDERTLLVYEMNGEPLPQEHGFPLRIYIPNRYGMKQPKWIEHMEVIGEEGPGYWVDRGWSAEAIARTTSVIDTAAVGEPDPETGAIPIGGIAWAGARGIERVEVQIDDGSWAEAALRVPPLSALTWVQWRYDWPPTPGRHTARVRAYDGTGELQVIEEAGRRPDGAAGVHSIDFEV